MTVQDFIDKILSDLASKNQEPEKTEIVFADANDDEHYPIIETWGGNQHPYQLSVRML